MLRISLKKESDRRNKLKKLLDKYCEIFAQDKKHVKQIKSSIIVNALFSLGNEGCYCDL